MSNEYIDEGGTALLNGERYRIVRPNIEQMSYQVSLSPEPPWDSSNPLLGRVEEETWHAGALKSLTAIPGSSEYGQNTDGRFPLRLLPSAEIQVADIPAGITECSNLFQALGWIFACCGRYVFRVDPTTGTVVLSKDFGALVSSVMGLRWEEAHAFVTTDELSNSLYKLEATGINPGGPDTWTTSTTSAYRLAAGINRLFKISKTGILRNLDTTHDPTDETQWGDFVQVGDTITPPTGLVAYDRTVLIGKAEGLFAVSEEGFGIPLIKRMVYGATNCLGMVNFDPFVLVPHQRGLYRWSPGDIRDAGLETELLNQSPVRGRVTTIAVDGNWFYAFVVVGNDTYCLVGRDKRSGEISFGPFIWETWLFLEGKKVYAAFIDSQASSPRLWFGYGLDLAYVTLSSGGGAPDVSGADYSFALSGLRYSVKERFGDASEKNFPMLKASGKNLSSQNYWELAYNIDGLGWVTTDVNGATMRVQSDEPHTFNLPISAHGREIQHRYSFVSDGTLPPPELSRVEKFAIPRSNSVRVNTFHLLLAANLHHEGGIETRSSTTQLADLTTLKAQALSILTSGPWGEDIQGVIRDLSLVQTRQGMFRQAEFVVQVTLQERFSV